MGKDSIGKERRTAFQLARSHAAKTQTAFGEDPTELRSSLPDHLVDYPSEDREELSSLRAPPVFLSLVVVRNTIFTLKIRVRTHGATHGLLSSGCIRLVSSPVFPLADLRYYLAAQHGKEEVQRMQINRDDVIGKGEAATLFEQADYKEAKGWSVGPEVSGAAVPIVGAAVLGMFFMRRRKGNLRRAALDKGAAAGEAQGNFAVKRV